MSWVSFVLDQWKHPWHVTSKTGLACATVVTNDGLCNFFFGHVFRNEKTERVWTTRKFNQPPASPFLPPTHTSHAPTCTFDVHGKKNTQRFSNRPVFQKIFGAKTGLCVFVFHWKTRQSKLFVRTFPAGAGLCNGGCFENLCVFFPVNLFRACWWVPQPHNTPHYTTTHRDTSQHTTHTATQTNENQTKRKKKKEKEREKESVRENERRRDVTDPIRLGRKFWINRVDKTLHTVQPRSKLSLSCGPRRKNAKTCPAYRSPFCTPRAGTSAHLPLGQRQGAGLRPGISAWLSQAAHLRPRQVSVFQASLTLVAPPYVFPDVLRTFVDDNVHLLERVAHIIMSPLSNVCMLTAANRKPMNLIHGQKKFARRPKSLCLCVFSFLSQYLSASVSRMHACHFESSLDLIMFPIFWKN